MLVGITIGWWHDRGSDFMLSCQFPAIMHPSFAFETLDADRSNISVGGEFGQDNICRDRLGFSGYGKVLFFSSWDVFGSMS